jgi:hypothetical protein
VRSCLLACVAVAVICLVAPITSAHATFAERVWVAPADVPAGTPVRLEVDAAKGYPAGILVVREENYRMVPVQRDPLSKSAAWIQLPFAATKGERVAWRPLFSEEFVAAPSPAFDCVSNGRDLVVKYGQQELLRYAIAERSTDDPSKDYLTRSGYFHPVTTLAGDVVTDDFCPDHPHQHGIFFAWTESRYGDVKTEFWNQHLSRGTIRHAGLGPSGGGSVLAGFEAKQVYRLPETDEPILEETWQARCFVIDANVWLLDLTVKQTALTDQPLVNQKYHYGGLGIRGERNWRPDVATFLTSEGKDRHAGNASRPVWTALSGPVEPQRPMIAVLDHPSNFRHPQPVRLHPGMPYFAIAPMAEGEFEVSREKPFQARYGIVVASEALSAERLDALQGAFAADPTLKLPDLRRPEGRNGESR